MILVISGTQDGREIIQELTTKGYPVIVSTATAYGASLIQNNSNCQVYHQRLGKEEMVSFIRNHKVRLLIDATHPYAVEVTANAIEACEQLNVPYLRLDRDESNGEKYHEILHPVSGYEEAAAYLKDTSGNILLTTGSKTLEIFTKNIEKSRIFARVLPTSDIIAKCEMLGLTPSNIIAMQGPFSKGMNLEMMKKYNIHILVTKDSGDIGGTLDKLDAAYELDISVVMIMRPVIHYSNVYKTMIEIMDKVAELYEKVLSNHAGH